MSGIVIILTTLNYWSLCLPLCLLSSCPTFISCCACNIQREQKSCKSWLPKGFPQQNWQI